MQIIQMLNSLEIESKNVRYQSHAEELINRTLDLEQGILSDSGALCVYTGTFTGRSPKDRS